MNTLKVCSGAEKFLYKQKDLISGHLTTPAGEIYLHTQKDIYKAGPNEDALCVYLDPSNKRIALIVADGMGGNALGDKASEIVVDTLSSELSNNKDKVTHTRLQILDGLEKANQKIIDLKAGAGSTCALIEMSNQIIRPYHIGDSSILIVGQRGKIKFQSVSHSPVGYALESGHIDEEQALAHEQLHEISNFIGTSDMRIEIGPFINCSPNDTVLLGSDGLFDNLRNEEIIEIIRKGPLTQCANKLIDAVNHRMRSPTEEDPSKPDDMTFILFRPFKSIAL